MSIPLVSIIIPTYNRAYIIADTLISIQNQTYPYWECLVIDDGSKDDTELLLQDYCKQDSRFQYHQRPKDRPKGANTCRNIKLDQACRDYVIFFDSDDLMTTNHIECKVNANKNECDYVIAKTDYFNHPIDKTI